MFMAVVLRGVDLVVVLDSCGFYSGSVEVRYVLGRSS